VKPLRMRQTVNMPMRSLLRAYETYRSPIAAQLSASRHSDAQPFLFNPASICAFRASNSPLRSRAARPLAPSTRQINPTITDNRYSASSTSLVLSAGGGLRLLDQSINVWAYHFGGRWSRLGSSGPICGSAHLHAILHYHGEPVFSEPATAR